VEEFFAAFPPEVRRPDEPLSSRAEPFSSRAIA